MALFQLDPQSIAARVRASGARAAVPGLGASVLRGLLGFTVVSVAGFAPWPLFAFWFHRVREVGREMGLYVACTLVFVGLSGALLHRLIIGPGSLRRFYQLFTLAFIAYAVAWVACWMSLRGQTGSTLGLLAGTVVMAAIFSGAFDAWRAFPLTAGALFLLNLAGFTAGGWVEGKIVSEHRLAAMLLWGVCYGAGLGAGLGLAFYLCQLRARALLAAACLFLLAVGAGAEPPTSEFTSTKKGVMLEESNSRSEIDFFRKRCPGLGGYSLLFLGDDARSWINLQYGKTVVDLRQATFDLSPGTFPNKANDAVEWRGTYRKGKFVPYALIYRLEGGNDETRVVRSRLIVIHLQGEHSSVAGFAQGREEEAEAKRIADQFKP